MKKHYESRKVLEGWGLGIRKGSRGGGGEGGRRGEPRGNLFKGAWQGDERPGAAVAA